MSSPIQGILNSLLSQYVEGAQGSQQAFDHAEAALTAYVEERQKEAKLEVWEQILGADLKLRSDDWISVPVEWIKSRLAELQKGKQS